MVENFRTVDFAQARGGTPDMRPNADKPYSPASYAAQYGVPVDYVQEFIAQHSGCTHGEVKAFIHRDYISDAEFRYAALNHVVRPYGEWTEEEKLSLSIQATGEEEAKRLRLAAKAGAFEPKTMPGVDPAEVERERGR